MWQIIGASVPGTNHSRIGLPCQDSHGYRIFNYGVIAAVADGLGSASRSDEGAWLAVETSLETLSQTLAVGLPSSDDQWLFILSDVFSIVRHALAQTAASVDLPMREFGTILIVSVITRNQVITGHIGDGAVVVLSEDDRLETISRPQQGEYANEVTPLTASDALAHVRCSIHAAPVKAVAMLTDGLQHLSINLITGTPHAPFFRPLLEGVCRPADADETSLRLVDFLNSERVCARTDDDKTLVLIGHVQCSSEIETGEPDPI